MEDNGRLSVYNDDNSVIWSSPGVTSAKPFLEVGDRLGESQKLNSFDGIGIATLFKGDFVIANGFDVKYASDTMNVGTAPYHLKLTNNQLGLYDGHGIGIWQAAQPGISVGFVYLSSGGRFEIFKSDSNGFWRAHDKILDSTGGTNDALTSNTNPYLSSANGRYYLACHGYGNMAIYRTSDNAMIWESGTTNAGSGGHYKCTNVFQKPRFQ